MCYGWVSPSPMLCVIHQHRFTGYGASEKIANDGKLFIVGDNSNNGGATMAVGLLFADVVCYTPTSFYQLWRK